MQCPVWLLNRDQLLSLHCGAQRGHQAGEQATAGAQAASPGQTMRLSSPRSASESVSMTFTPTEQHPRHLQPWRAVPTAIGCQTLWGLQLLHLLNVPACCAVHHCSVMAVTMTAVTCCYATTCAMDCRSFCRCCIVFGHHGAPPQGERGPGSAGRSSSRSSSSHQGSGRCADCRSRIACFALQRVGSCGPSALSCWLVAWTCVQLGHVVCCVLCTQLHASSCVCK